MQIIDISPEAPAITRADWIIAVLALIPGAEEDTPARRDAGASVVIRVPGKVMADILWRNQSPKDAADEIRAHIAARFCPLVGDITSPTD